MEKQENIQEQTETPIQLEQNKEQYTTNDQQLDKILEQNISEEQQQQKQEIQKNQIQQKQDQLRKDMLKKITFKFKDKNIHIDAKTMVAFKMTKTDKTPIHIFQNIYLGSIGAALSKEELKNFNIKYVLNAVSDQTPEYPDWIEKFKQIKLKDSLSQVIIGHFEESNQFIQEAVNKNENILVHCFAGKSRSVTLIIAYLMFSQKMTRDEALYLIRQKRPQASPNFGFMKQLLLYESILKKNQQQMQNINQSSENTSQNQIIINQDGTFQNIQQFAIKKETDIIDQNIIDQNHKKL